MQQLYYGLSMLSYQQLIMMLVGGALIYLAIRHRYEPTLLLPIGFGTIRSISLFLRQYPRVGSMVR